MCFGRREESPASQPPESTPSGNAAPVAAGNPNAAAYATPAASPAAPLPAPEEPEIGKRRRAQVRAQFGANKPSYRVRDDTGSVGPDGRISM